MSLPLNSSAFASNSTIRSRVGSESAAKIFARRELSSNSIAGRFIVLALSLLSFFSLTLPGVRHWRFFCHRILSRLVLLLAPDRTPPEAICNSTGCPTAENPRFLITPAAATSVWVVYPQFSHWCILSLKSFLPVCVLQLGQI